jgi:putative ABC transport system substrate-binding protein
VKILIQKNFPAEQESSNQRRTLSAGMLLAMRLLLFCLASNFLFLLCASGALSADRFAIIYPEVSSPYSAIFQTIIQGVKSQDSAYYQLFPLREDQNIDQLRSQIEAAQLSGIIALGKRGYQTTQLMAMPLPTVIGALPLIPNGISGISLSADPERIFAKLKSLVPETKQVFVVYSPKANGWLLPYAEKAAQKHGLLFEAFAAKDLRETMLLYRQLLLKIRGRSNTIWLPLDKLTADENIVLPMLLQEAWDKDLVIVSSKPTDVQRGALFSMYPDNFGLGQELAENLRQQQKQGKTGVVPLKMLHLAVNLRTAAHLGLNFSNSQQQTFHLSFPSR